MSKCYYVIGNLLGKMTQILNPFNLWDSLGWWNLWTQTWSVIVLAIYIGIDAQVTLNVLHSKNKFTLSFSNNLLSVLNRKCVRHIRNFGRFQLRYGLLLIVYWKYKKIYGFRFICISACFFKVPCEEINQKKGIKCCRNNLWHRI